MTAEMGVLQVELAPASAVIADHVAAAPAAARTIRRESGFRRARNRAREILGICKHLHGIAVFPGNIAMQPAFNPGDVGSNPARLCFDFRDRESNVCSFKTTSFKTILAIAVPRI